MASVEGANDGLAVDPSVMADEVNREEAIFPVRRKKGQGIWGTCV
jgi:hypothetical protein